MFREILVDVLVPLRNSHLPAKIETKNKISHIPKICMYRTQ